MPGANEFLYVGFKRKDTYVSGKRMTAGINLINQLVEPIITPLSDAYAYPQLTLRPEADCKRYEMLCSGEEVAA